MSRLLPSITIFAFVLLIAARAENPPAPNKELQAKITELRKQKILSTLANAQTIVLCDFISPHGFTVRKVLRGRAKIGDIWNFGDQPRKSVVMHERFQTGDLNGGTISTSGCFPLAGPDKIIISEADSSALTIEEIKNTSSDIRSNKPMAPSPQRPRISPLGQKDEVAFPRAIKLALKN